MPELVRIPRRKTISTRFSLALISILSLILLLFAVLATVVNVARISDELKAQMNSYLNVSAATLSVPVWNFDVDTVRGVVDAIMLDSNIAFAHALSDDETIVLRRAKQYDGMDYSEFGDTGNFIRNTIPIEFENEQIGSFQLVISRESAHRQMLFQIASILLLMILIIAAILITSLVMSRRAITRPLTVLQRYAAAITAGDLNATVDLRRDDEIGLLANDLDDMRFSLSNLIEKLQGTNDELETANRTLEDRVKERTASVNQAQQRLVDAIDSASDGFAFFDSDDKLVLSNQSYVNLLYDGNTDIAKPGMSFAQILNNAVNEGLVTSPNSNIDDFVARRLEEHNNPGDPVIQQHHDNRWVQITERRTNDGGTVAIYSDLTDLKKNEAALASTVNELEHARDTAMEATQAKSQFLANMSHELRTPLNAIIGYSELLHDDATDTGHSEFIPDLEKIRDAGKHLLNLINDILDLSKIEAGKMTVHIEKFDVAQLISEVQSLIQPVLAAKNNTLEVNLPESVGEMESDQTKLRQNLFNLLSNAAKFTENGKISLSVEHQLKQETPHLVFTVTDTGIGMSQQQQERLFEAFLQADTSISRDFGGSGLGLSISKQFCHLLGGDITVQSEQGVGSAFSMTLPVVLHVEKQNSDKPPIASVRNGYRVLIIDDDPDVLQDLGGIFSAEGYEVHTARNGEEGLSQAEKVQPDIITLDIILPALDGWSVLKALKSNPSLKHIPVVVLSVLGDEEMGYALGAVDYISKPIDRDLVVETIHRFRDINTLSRVLVVDDDDDTRDMLRRTIETVGCKVSEAKNGHDALELIAQSKPTVVLLDIMMPEMDGFEFLERLRAEPDWNDINVIIVSAKDLNQSDLNWLNNRSLQIFQKGVYDRSHLIETVSNALDNSTNLAN